ncbi:hypothetical protein I4U23_021813 [Adineta vaga]|nr:hypothetical protein I4U23_021813 [Adineta vaga]
MDNNQDEYEDCQEDESEDEANKWKFKQYRIEENVYGSQHKTNYVCEGFHNRLNRRIEQAHANIWSFIRCIINRESRFQHLYVKINTGSQMCPNLNPPMPVKKE